MFKLTNGGNNPVYTNFARNVSCNLSFYVSGLTSFAKLLLLDKIKDLSKKKILFVTASEQYALKYQNDLAKAFSIDAKVLPYQSVSMYEEINSNKYDYA